MDPVPQQIPTVESTPLSEAPTETNQESLTSSSESLATGKRVRKKNPKYLDEENGTHEQKVVDSIPPPTKKRKTSLNDSPSSVTTTSNESPIIVPTIISPYRVLLPSLDDQRKNLELQKQAIAKDLDEINQQLVCYGVTVESTAKDIMQYGQPTDDEEDDPMDISTIPTVPKPKPVRARAKPKTTRRKTTTPRKPTKRKSTTTPPAVQRPKRVPKQNDVPLLPEFMFCREILDQLMKHRYGSPFNVPVDPEALGIPDYPLIIKYPMDFGTIRNKLNTSQYSHPSDYISDVNLVFNNACTYNRPNSDVFHMADTLRKLFRDKVKILDRQISSDNPVKDIDSMRKELYKLEASTKPKPRRTVQTRRTVEDPKPLTKEEKKKLSIGIKTLNGSQLAVVVKIIKEKLPDIGGEKEIVIDIDSLDAGTLRALESFVQSTKRKKQKRSSSKRGGTTALQADPAARLELAKQTEIGMQSKIESVQRQLEELSGGNGLSSSTSGFAAPKKGQSPQPTPTSPPAQNTPETVIQDPIPHVQQAISEEESESESEESESESEESDSDTESRVSYESKAKNSTVVETVVAPILSNTAVPSLDNAPRIISTSPTASEVNADKIENVASWADLGSSKEDEAETANNQSSEGASNLWSSIRDSHAQMKQKEHEKILHEERLKKEQEEEEAERLRKEEEDRQRKLEEEERQKQLEEEAKIQAEKEIEEARLRAKRDREKKVQEDESGDDLLSLDSFAGLGGLTGPGLMQMNLSGQVMSDIRSSLKASGPLDQRSPEHNN